jgi:hypothetical protein
MTIFPAADHGAGEGAMLFATEPVIVFLLCSGPSGLVKVLYFFDG